MVIMHSKKSQIEIMEMIMVLVVVVIMLSLGIFYYYKFYIADIEQKEDQLSDIERDVLLASVLTLPEIQCSLNTVEHDCIDMVKVKINIIESNKIIYIPKFGFRVIKIEQIYPPGVIDTIYSNPRPNFKTKEVISTPVSLYYARDDYRIGKLIIEDYRR